MSEAFVYSWKNKTTGRLYVGWHKGSPDDGYICSSRVLNEEYKKDPHNFERFIIANGTAEDMVALESAILKAADAKNNPGYYNQHNGDGFYRLGNHTEDTKRKISGSLRGKKREDVKLRNLTNNPAKTEKAKLAISKVNRSGERNSRFGVKVSEETKKKISSSRTGKLKGVKKSEETKKKISSSRTGKLKGVKKSEETRRKMSIARKAFWEGKRRSE